MNKSPIQDIPFIKHYSINLYDKSNALKLLNELENNSIPLYGIDGFRKLEQDKYQIEQDYSIDLSIDPYKFTDFTLEKVYQLSKELIEKCPLDTYFEFVYDEK